jgi:hypothetical protein
MCQSKGSDGVSATAACLLRGLLAIVGLLIAATSTGGEVKGPLPEPGAAGGARPEEIRAAVARALPLLVRAGAVEYPRHRDCFSCHNQAMPAVALDLARRHGFPVEAETLRAIAEHTEADLATALEDYRKGKGQPGSVIRAGYALWTLDAAGWTPDETTAAVVHYLAAVLGRRDHWLAGSRRPPSESSDFTATALALRGLRAFGVSANSAAKPGNQQPLGEPSAIDAPRRVAIVQWLRQTQPRETEDRVFRLWALKLADGAPSDLEPAVADLLRLQRPDGGWSQLDGAYEPPKTNDAKGAAAPERSAALAHSSDAYATGSVLAALHLAGGVHTELSAYRRGLSFLVRSQREDGSWLVKSRSHPFQTYFESGFPHGPDQFISAAGSAWAVAALTLACPRP